MAVGATIRRYAIGGMSRMGDLDAENAGALWTENLVPSTSGGLVSRRGFKVCARIGPTLATFGCPAFGMAVARIPDLTTSPQTMTDELLIATQTSSITPTTASLARAKRYLITFSRTGGVDARFSIVNVSGSWHFMVYSSASVEDALAGSGIIYDGNLGTAAGPGLTLAQLQTALAALSPVVTLTIPSDLPGTTPAAILPTTIDADADSVTIGFVTAPESLYVSEGPAPQLGLLGHSVINGNPIPTRLFQGVQFQNRLWFRDIWRLRKYDGKNAFPAGVRAPLQATLTAGTTGSIADGDYRYGITFSVKDAQNYEVESDLYEAGTITIAGADDDVTISNIQGRGGWVPGDAGMTSLVSAGWGAVCSSSMGAAGATVTCATYLRLDAGDPVYLYDRATSAYVERYVVSTTATTVTLNSNVQMNSGDAMSPVRVNIYRSKVGPSSLFYLVDTVPANISASTQSYLDIKADASLGLTYEPPIAAHTPPTCQPNSVTTYHAEEDSGSYPIEVYDNSIYLGGLYEDRGAIAFSDVDNPEYFPEENRLRPGEGNEDITGLKALKNALLIFTRNNSYIMTGNPVAGTARIDYLGRQGGCSAQSSIADCAGVTYWCSSTGVYRSDGAAPEKISGPIQYFFDRNAAGRPRWGDELGVENIGPRAKFSNAVGVYDPAKHQYWLSIPLLMTVPDANGPEEPDNLGLYGWAGGAVLAKAKVDPLEDVTTCFVFDIARSEWYPQTQVNFGRGALMFSGGMFALTMPVLDEFGPIGGTSFLTQRIDRIDNYACVDDSPAGDAPTTCLGIPIDYQSRYDSIGQPGVLKRAHRMRIEALNDLDLPNWNPVATTSINYARSPSTRTVHSQKTIPLTSSAPEHKWRLKPGRLRSIAWELTSSGTIYEQAVLTGVEIEFAEAYRKVFKEPNG